MRRLWLALLRAFWRWRLAMAYRYHAEAKAQLEYEGRRAESEVKFCKARLAKAEVAAIEARADRHIAART